MTAPDMPFLSRVEYDLSADSAITSSDAPRLYAWLLEQLSPQEAECVHEGEGQAISQHVRTERRTGRTIWSVSLLSREANSAILPALQEKMTIDLHPETLQASLLRRDSFGAPLEFIQTVEQQPDLPGGTSFPAEPCEKMECRLPRISIGG